MQVQPRVECNRIFDGTLKVMFGNKHLGDLPRQSELRVEDVENILNNTIAKLVAPLIEEIEELQHEVKESNYAGW